MFAYVDAFMAEVAAVSALAQVLYTLILSLLSLLYYLIDQTNALYTIYEHTQSLVPGMAIALDESGTDMDNVLGAGSPPTDNPFYWVAGGGYFAYLWSQV